MLTAYVNLKSRQRDNILRLLKPLIILVPIAHGPFGLRQGTRSLAEIKRIVGSGDENGRSYYACKASYIQALCTKYLTIILRNRAEYHLILSRRGRRPSWLNQGIFRKIEQDNCFIIQQIPMAYHFQNEKNYGSMIKTLKASNT